MSQADDIHKKQDAFYIEVWKRFYWGGVLSDVYNAYKELGALPETLRTVRDIWEKDFQRR